MKSRVIALVGALFLIVWVTLPALAAAPPGKVTVLADGCSFTVQINLDHAYDLVGWKVKQYNAANWNEGLTLFKGSGPTDGNGDMTVGPFTAPEGHYTVAVDNEYPPDGSSIVVDFWLSCPVSSGNPDGSEAPIDSSMAPSAPPTGSEAPAEGSAPPSGEVKGIHGTPPVGITPPPTDTSVGGSSSLASGLPVVLAVIMGLAVAALMLVPGPVAAASRIVRSRRRR